MIISHKHKFIYFKSCKTAGTSIEVFLSAYLQPNDIATRIREPVATWHKARPHNGLKNHTTAIDALTVIGANIFYNYYKFTSIRNPLDKMLSLYFWRRSVHSLDYSFSDWIMAYNFNDELPVFHEPFYKINGKAVMDDYIRFESLEDDLERVCVVLGMEYRDEYLLHYKKTKRRGVVITEEAKAKIRDKFKQELIDLDYEI